VRKDMTNNWLKCVDLFEPNVYSVKLSTEHGVPEPSCDLPSFASPSADSVAWWWRHDFSARWWLLISCVYV